MKVRVAWKGKTLFSVRFRIWQTACIAADAFPKTLLMRGDWIMNQGFNPVLLKETSQAISLGRPDNEQMVNMTCSRRAFLRLMPIMERRFYIFGSHGNRRR